MTSNTIEAEDSSVAIEITGIGGHEDELLAAFGDCQQGRCSCPHQ